MSQIAIDFAAPHNGTVTSKAAAKRLTTRSRDCDRIMNHIKAMGMAGATCDECEFMLGLPHQSASARIRDLVLAGVIHHHGERTTRSNRAARVYFLTQRKP